MPASTLRQVLDAVVAENESRQAANRRLLFVLFEQIYGSLAYAPAEHVNPLALVPEAAPYVIALDGISKAITYGAASGDRKSTRLNSSHLGISYAVFCLTKKYTTTSNSRAWLARGCSSQR